MIMSREDFWQNSSEDGNNVQIFVKNPNKIKFFLKNPNKMNTLVKKSK